MVIIYSQMESRNGRLYHDSDQAPISLHGDWAYALNLVDRFQSAPRMSREVARIFHAAQEETKLTLVSVNYVPMFVQLPAKRVGQDGKVRLSWGEVRALGGVPDNGCIKLD